MSKDTLCFYSAYVNVERKKEELISLIIVQ